MDTTSEYFSARQLAEIEIPGYPATARRFKDLADRDGWTYRDIPSPGRGGIRREYQPPAHVLALIRARQAGELPAATPAKPSHAAVMAAGARALAAEMDKNHQALKAGAVAVSAQAEQRACATYLTLKLLENDAVRVLPKVELEPLAEAVYTALSAVFGSQVVSREIRKYPAAVEAAIALVLAGREVGIWPPKTV